MNRTKPTSTLVLLAGLLFAAPARAVTNDADNDSFLDAWEQSGNYVNGVSLYNRGCRANHADLLIYLSPLPGVDVAALRTQMEKVRTLYANLTNTNPDGTTGINLHYSIGPTIASADAGDDWAVNRGRYLPPSFEGLYHWMQISAGGGGNADFGDGGGSGDRWTTFAHELGHQLGLDHQGGWKPDFSPLYPSMMNYSFAYSFRGSEDNVQYSPGTFVGYSLRESSLSENLPYRVDRLDYLRQAPYRFTVISTGPNSSAVDWNRNGVIDQSNVRADINTGNDTELGERFRVGEALSAPWLFTVSGRLFVAYGYNSSGSVASASNPIDLRVREVHSDGSTDGVFVAAGGLLRGDPVVATFNGRTFVFFPGNGVIEKLWIDPIARQTIASTSFPSPAGFAPTAAGTYQGVFVVLLWNRTTKDVRYTYSTTGDTWTTPAALTQSTVAPGFTVDGQDRFVLARGANLGPNDQSRIWIGYYQGLASTGALHPWLSGFGDQLIGGMGTTANDWSTINVSGRLQPLYDASGRAGEAGKLLVLGRYLGSSTQMVMAQQVSDTGFNGGWNVKTVYNQWSMTRSATSWCAYNGDFAVGYRWTDNDEHTNDLTVSFRGSGIELDPMGDRNDITALYQGLRSSLSAVRSSRNLSFSVTSR